jgi:hypothetical protein
MAALFETRARRLTSGSVTPGRLLPSQGRECCGSRPKTTPAPVGSNPLAARLGDLGKGIFNPLTPKTLGR